jgi:carbon storage regulator
MNAGLFPLKERHASCVDVCACIRKVLSSQFSKEGRCIILILSRKAGERIKVGDDVVLTVVRIGPNAVRFGIDAPKEMNIVRDELLNLPIQATEADIAELGRRPA